MSKLDELREQEEELEKEIIEYKEVDDNRNARKTEKKLARVRELINIEFENKQIQMYEKLEIYKKFIQKYSLSKKFEKFYDEEVKRREE